jgi:hypothetical protein
VSERQRERKIEKEIERKEREREERERKRERERERESRYFSILMRVCVFELVNVHDHVVLSQFYC